MSLFRFISFSGIIWPLLRRFDAIKVLKFKRDKISLTFHELFLFGMKLQIRFKAGGLQGCFSSSGNQRITYFTNID